MSDPTWPPGPSVPTLAAHAGVVWPVRADPTGKDGPTRMQVRGRHWVRTAPGLYVPADTDRDRVEQRIVESAARLPAYGALTGWAALRWLGASWFDGLEAGGKTQRPVVLAVGGCDNARAQPGTTVSKERLRPDEMTVVDGVAVTLPARSLLFEMRYAPNLWEAVAAADMAAEADLVSTVEAWEQADQLNGWTGIPQAREALPLTDENVWSVAEVRLRKAWWGAGLPRPLCNVPVFDLAGNHLGTPDLLDPVAGVAAEYDGAVHLDSKQRSKDLTREDRLRGVGLEYVAFVGPDLRDPSAVARRLRSAYARAKRVPAADRRWTLDQPYWWVDTSTVAKRRALDAVQREVWLNRRAG